MLPVALTYAITATAVILILFLLNRCRTLVVQRNALRTRCGELEQQSEQPADNMIDRNAVYAEVGERYQYRIDQLRSRIDHLTHYVFRLPYGPNIRVLDTPIGFFAIRTAGGYFAETAIMVYFPIGFGFSQEIADALWKATEGRFIMNPAPGSSSGGDDSADAIISAGLDYNAHLRGEQGYFKVSTPPDLDEIAGILSHIIVHPRGVTAQP